MSSSDSWKIPLSHQTDVQVGRQGVVSRREMLRAVAAGGVATGLCSFADTLALQAAQLRQKGMSCILLWMQGAPSQFETLDPKPGHRNGGETKAISTSIPGVQIAENLPELAKQLHQVSLLRSLTNKEGNHLRATFQLHTGYVPSPTVKYPTLGSIASYHIPDQDCQLPAFVRIGSRGRQSGGGGFLGVEHDPFLVADASRMPENSRILTPQTRHNRRLRLLDALEADFAATGGQQQVEDHRKLYHQATEMVLSPQMQALDINKEPASTRDAYTRTGFGNACLLARRLIETGVTFVEINHGNWDTHFDNFDRTRQLTRQIDQPFAHLLTDLSQRGLLEKTLVIWMGEFGRTPRVNPRGGRDHYPRAWSAILAGAGIGGGQVIGATDAGGVNVSDRPIAVPDLFRTFCHTLKIDPDYEFLTGLGRPIKTVDGGQVINELFS